jgi:hypothetical protein
MRPSITKDPRATRSISPGCQAGVPMKLRFALGTIYRAKSWTMRSVADAKWSATRNSSVASCYQPPSCLVDDDFHLGSVSSAVKCPGGIRGCRSRFAATPASGAERPLPPPQASWQNYQPDRSFIRTGDRNPLLIVQLENPGVPFRGFPFSESGALWPEQGSCPGGLHARLIRRRPRGARRL